MNKDYDINPAYYSKKGLIDAYVQGQMSTRTGYRWFSRELARYPGLTDRLAALGYSPHQRTLTRAQLIAIFDAIGEP